MSFRYKKFILIFSLFTAITAIALIAHAQDILRSPKWQIEKLISPLDKGFEFAKIKIVNSLHACLRTGVELFVL